MTRHPVFDESGRAFRWPKKVADKELLLARVASAIEPGRDYTEADINAIIIRAILFDDYAIVRRELYDRGHIDRTPDGRKYWRALGPTKA